MKTRTISRTASVCLALAILLGQKVWAQQEKIPTLASPPNRVNYIVETFRNSPFDTEGGRWHVSGPGFQNNQWIYDVQNRQLRAHLDSRLETTRLNLPIGSAISGQSACAYAVEFTFLTEGFYASPYGFFQVAFGLSNSQTSGPDRTGGIGDGGDDSYDMIEWDFWPNVSPYFNSPNLGPTIFGGRVGDSLWNNFSFLFGDGTSLKDEIDEGLLPPTGIPFDTRLRAVVTYDPLMQQVRTSLAALQNGRWEPLQIRVPPTPTNALNPYFSCDQFSISLYYDPYNPGNDDPSLVCNLLFHKVEIMLVR